MKIKHFAISSFMFLIIQVLSLSVIGSAESFTCSEGGFSIWMPSEPILQRVSHKSFAGKVKESSYTLKTEQAAYVSSYTELPGIAFSFLSDNAIFNKARKSFLKAVGAQELSFEKIIFEGKGGRELAFQVLSKNPSTRTGGKARFYLFGKRLYVMTVTANQSPEGSALIDRYLNSFKLLPAPGKEFSLN